MLPADALSLSEGQWSIEGGVLAPTLFVPMTGAAEEARRKQPDPKNPQIVNGDFELAAMVPGTVRGRGQRAVAPPAAESPAKVPAGSSPPNATATGTPPNRRRPGNRPPAAVEPATGEPAAVDPENPAGRAAGIPGGLPAGWMTDRLSEVGITSGKLDWRRPIRSRRGSNMWCLKMLSSVRQPSPAGDGH